MNFSVTYIESVPIYGNKGYIHTTLKWIIEIQEN